jgi:hypothetical protein
VKSTGRAHANFFAKAGGSSPGLFNEAAAPRRRGRGFGVASLVRTLLRFEQDNEDAVPALMTLEKRRLHGAVRPIVVIADGDSLYRWFVNEALATREVHVVQCRTMSEAAAFLQRRRVADLLIVDAQTLRDEGDAGMDALHRASRSAPCVLLDALNHETHLPSEPDIVVVEKPVDSNVLAALVDQQLRGMTPLESNTSHPGA